MHTYVNLNPGANLHHVRGRCKCIFARCVNLHGVYFMHVNAKLNIHTMQMTISACKIEQNKIEQNKLTI